MMSTRLLIPGPAQLILLVLLAVSFPAAAHHVSHDVTRGEAVVVSLAYGNGSPLAFDRYDIISEGEETPFQSGTTDAEGRIVFLPDRTCVWRVKVFSEDGHGADFTFEAGPVKAKIIEPDTGLSVDEVVHQGQPPADNTVTAEVVEAEKKKFIERFAGPVAGVGFIFGVFGLFTLFVRRRR